MQLQQLQQVAATDSYCYHYHTAIATKLLLLLAACGLLPQLLLLV
jgi:hypothetical protein